GAETLLTVVSAADGERSVRVLTDACADGAQLTTTQLAGAGPDEGRPFERSPVSPRTWGSRLAPTPHLDLEVPPWSVTTVRLSPACLAPAGRASRARALTSRTSPAVEDEGVCHSFSTAGLVLDGRPAGARGRGRPEAPPPRLSSGGERPAVGHARLPAGRRRADLELVAAGTRPPPLTGLGR